MPMEWNEMNHHTIFEDPIFSSASITIIFILLTSWRSKIQR
jgi:hypothetical protein